MRTAASLALAVALGCGTLRLIPESKHLLCPPGEGSACDVILYEGGLSNAVAVRTEAGTILFDTKMKCYGRRLLDRLAEDGFTPVRWIGITHPHCDHLSGLAHYRASPELREIWAADTVESLIGPHKVKRFESDGERRVGDLVVKILRFPHAHTGGDLAFWLPQKGMLLTGDVFQCGYYPHAERPDGGSYKGLLAAVKRLTALEPKPTTIIGGHGGVCDFAALQAYAEYLEAVIERGETVDMPGYQTIRDPCMRIVAGSGRLSACSKQEAREAGPDGWADRFDQSCVQKASDDSAACMWCRDRLPCDKR
jgi:glyoxylase-like metal-dependent hydrolase (beta-lactamase superfamily II)